MCWCHANACLDLLSGALDSSQPGFKHAWSTENALICDIFLAAHSGAASLLLSSDLSAVRDATGWRGGSCFVCETFQPFFSDPEIAAGSWFSSTPKRNLHGITATHQPVPTPLVYFKQWGKESATALSEHSKDDAMLVVRGWGRRPGAPLYVWASGYSMRKAQRLCL